MKLKISLACLALAVSASAKTTPDDGVINSVDSIKSLWAESCLQYLPVSPPTSDSYVDIRENVLAVDWKSFKKKAFTSQMYAEMDSNGFPIYRVGVRQDFWTGETLFYNSYGTEVLRLAPTEKDYDPYAWAKDYFQVSATTELSEMQRMLYPSSKIELEVFLLPEIFLPTYREIEAEQAAQKLAVQKLSATATESDSVRVGMTLVPAISTTTTEPMAMAMSSSPPPPPTGGGGTNSVSGGGSSNLLVELTIHLPEGFGYLGHIELFTKDDLIYSTSWGLADSWVPSHGSQTVKWIDPASSNKMERFYYINDGADSDGDGYSDLREVWVEGTDSNSFNIVNTDGDDLNDWLEYKLFGDLSQTGSSDFDGDQIPNNEELIFDAAGRPVALLTDPTLFSSDGDVLGDGEQFNSPPTDPWNPDADKPSASISWPTNNAVVIF